MKQLQNDFTTPEQSKRLLELGVPADSADMYWNSTQEHDKVVWFHVGVRQEGINFPDWTKSWRFGGLFGKKIPYYLPCWSVGRLDEICKICEPKKDYEQLCDEMKECQNYCVLILSHIIANLPIINFSKLEE